MPVTPFRAILGLKHSRLSREILAFGIFLPAAGAFTFTDYWTGDETLIFLSGLFTVASGYVGIFCSAKIYAFTKRHLWQLRWSMSRFLLTSILAAATAGPAISLHSVTGLDYDAPAVTRLFFGFGFVVFAAILAKLAIELFPLLSARKSRTFSAQTDGNPSASALKRTAQLLLGPLRSSLKMRVFLGLAGGIVAVLFFDGVTANSVSLSTFLVFTGEFIVRYQYFTAVSPPRIAGESAMNAFDGLNPKQLLHAKTGPLTRELLREPGKFGLGQLPVINTPDATTRLVCGFCSTGCSLDLHLGDGEAINLSPTTDYPVNLGMACPKGWEALSVMDAHDRATMPLRRLNKKKQRRGRIRRSFLVGRAGRIYGPL